MNRFDSVAMIMRGNNNIPNEKNMLEVNEPVTAVPNANTPIISMQLTNIFML